jgi:hypothetical protein
LGKQREDAVFLRILSITLALSADFAIVPSISPHLAAKPGAIAETVLLPGARHIAESFLLDFGHILAIFRLCSEKENHLQRASS